MSNEEGATLAGLATRLFGVIILVLGALLTYFSLNADVGAIDPRIFSPLGLVVALLGGVMLLAKEA